MFESLESNWKAFEHEFCPLLLSSCFDFKIEEVTPYNNEWGTDIVVSLKLNQLKQLKNDYKRLFRNIQVHDSGGSLIFLVQVKCQSSIVNKTKLMEFWGGWRFYKYKYGRVDGFIAITTSKFPRLEKIYKESLVFITGINIIRLMEKNSFPFYRYFCFDKAYSDIKKDWKTIIKKCVYTNKETVHCHKCNRKVKIEDIKFHLDRCDHLRHCIICHNDIKYYDYPKHLKNCLKRYIRKEKKKLGPEEKIKCPYCGKEFKSDELKLHFFDRHYPHSYK